MQKIVILVFTLIIVIQANAQRAKGSWQDYLSYFNATKIALSADKVFCATNGGLMYYDLEDNSVNRFNDMATLSDFGIKTIAYNKSNDVLIIAYTNGNIDLVYGSSVVNLPDIKRKQLTGDKSINNIVFIDNEAYLACSFGIVVLSLEKKEIKDTYFIGDGGTSVVVNDVEADDNYFYAATDNGILKAERTEENLQDYSNWTKVNDIMHSNGKFSHLALHMGKLIANYTPEGWYEDEMYVLNGGTWQSYLTEIRYAYDIQDNGKYLLIASRDAIFIVNENDQIAQKITSYQLGDELISPINPRSAAMYENGSLWIADNQQSLVKVTGNNYEAAVLNGPFDNDIFSLSYSGRGLWVTPGTTKGWKFGGFQRYEKDNWSYFNQNTHSELESVLNVISVAVNPLDQQQFFVGTWGSGLLEFKNDELVEQYTNHNSPLETALPQQPDEPYVRIGGLAFDSDGNLWMTNSNVAKNLLKLSPEGSWEEYTLPEVAGANYNIREIIVTQNGDKWIIVSAHDAYVVDKNVENKKRLQVTSYFNNGENEIFNRMNDIFCIAEDNEGAIWLGTSKGVAVYSNPSRIWNSDNFYAIQPSLDLNDDYYHPLLETETITAIAVDGANRKWLGTQNSGIYLVSENGDAEVLHFTAENSPLYSNTITSIAINPKNGEVFIGTSDGLISYMGEATQGNDSYANVYVYPNPVRETYDGPVTVTGLKENTEIKITDIAGNLVFRTQSLGGQAIWDGTNLNGNRVRTGVYLVFCNDEMGEETHITKLLFIN